MSGGVAYVWDPKGRFPGRCNTETVLLERVEDDDERGLLWRLIEMHYTYPSSTVAKRLLRAWDLSVLQIVKAMPVDFKLALAATALDAAAIHSAPGSSPPLRAAG